MAAKNANAIAKALRAEKRVLPPALQEAGDNARNALRAVLSVPYPPPSAPGTPPHSRTGGVRDSFRSPLINAKTIRLGTANKIALYLEAGTHSHKTGHVKMAPRPFFVKFATTVFPQKVRESLIKYMGAAARGSR